MLKSFGSGGRSSPIPFAPLQGGNMAKIGGGIMQALAMNAEMVSNVLLSFFQMAATRGGGPMRVAASPSSPAAPAGGGKPAAVANPKAGPGMAVTAPALKKAPPKMG